MEKQVAKSHEGSSGFWMGFNLGGGRGRGRRKRKRDVDAWGMDH